MNSKSSVSPYSEIYVWGNDTHGQLGISTTQGKRYNSPKFCSFNVVINSISCGLSHTAFIASNGCIYTMGSNEDGKLGIGSRDVQNSFSPCLIESLSKNKAIQVSCGARHTGALFENGKAYFWGYGGDGQLGTDDYQTYNTPQVLNTLHLKNTLKSQSIGYLSCGNNHSMIITEDGVVCGFGSSAQGQLGTGQRKLEKVPVAITCFTEKIRKVAAGNQHTLFLTTSKKVYACGENSQGQLGIGNKKNSFLPVKIMLLENIPIQKICAREFSAALTEMGEVYQWGDPKKNQLFPELRKISNAKIEDIDIGTNFGVCLDADGNVFSWGNNTYGELGTGDFEYSETFTNISSLKGRKIKGVNCGVNFTMVLGGAATNSDENRFLNPPISEDIERIKESVFLKNKHNNSAVVENGLISKRNKAYMKSSENFFTGSVVNSNETLNTNDRNYLNDVTNNLVEGKSIKAVKNMTPIRHLTSEEIKSRQKKVVQTQNKSTNGENFIETTNEGNRGVENENPEEKYQINNKDAERLKNLIRNNEIKTYAITSNHSQINFNPVKIEIKNGVEEGFCKSPHPNIILNEANANLSLKNDCKRYEKYSKYTSFHENCASSDSKPKFESHLKANSIHLTSRYAYEKKESIDSLREKISSKQIQNENKPMEVKESNEISIKEYDTLKSQMTEMLNKITGFEEDQKEIEVLKVEQNDLKENYLKLEQKYLNLEEKFKIECNKTQSLNSDLGIEKKKTQDLKNSFEEKLKILNEKLNEKEQDIKYLKTENLKSQNFYDENLKTLKAQEEKKLEKFEESIQQLTEGLKNLEDENKFLENNLQNKDSLLEKIKKENEEMHKSLKKMESEMINLEQANSKLKCEFSEKDKNFSHEKSTFLDENRNLNKILKEKEEEIQNLYLEGKKSANDLTERDHRNKQEKNGYVNRISELEKSLSDKILEKEYFSNELKQEQAKTKQLEVEFEKLKKLLQEKNAFNFQGGLSKPPFHKSDFDFNNNNDGKVSPSFKILNKDNLAQKNLNDSTISEKQHVRIRSFGQQIKNSEEVSTPVVNSEYYQIKQKREQKQLNLRNANKAGSEKSSSLSRENKAKQEEEDEILTEAQIEKDQENSLNNSVLFNSNINEIKSKLSNLQKNKAFLEKRMKDFEKKIKESKSPTASNN